MSGTCTIFVRNGAPIYIGFCNDDYNNVTSVKDDLGNEVITEYDLLDRVKKVTDGNGNITEYQYDGLLLDVIKLPPNQASGTNVRETTFYYNFLNQLAIVERQIDSLGTQATRADYVHNNFGELVTLSREKGGQERDFDFEYDLLGRPVKTTDPHGEVTETAYEPFCVGQTSTSARGVRRKTSFDSRCLLREVLAGEVNMGDPLVVNNPRERHTFDYDELGRMVRRAQTTGVYGAARIGTSLHQFVEEFDYDELDRLKRISRTQRSEFGEVRFGGVYTTGPDLFHFDYDPEGNLIKKTDPQGRVTEYAYYRDGLLKDVIVKEASQSDKVFTYSYDDAGRLDKIVYPSSTSVEVLFRNEADLTPTGIGTGFDANGNLRFMRYQKTNGTLLRRFEYTYDSSNNRISALDVTPTKAIKWEYGYDWLDRLVTVKRAEAADVGSLPATTLQREYVFDESDNRTFLDDHVNGKTYHYKYKVISGTSTESDQLEEILISNTAGDRTLPGNFVSLETFLHDVDGNMTRRTIASTSEEIDYEWTDFDRLEKVSSNQNGTFQENVYDISGLRSRKKDKNGNSSQEYGVDIMTSASLPGPGTSSAPSISYIHGHMILGAEIDDGTGSEFVYHLPDALGTTRDVIDDSGTVIRSSEFDEYGNLLNSSGTGAATPKTWIGGLSVNDDTADSGMFNMGHRNYAGGVLGRFISRDPIGFNGSSMNLYAYPTDPVNSIDPSGLEPVYTDNPLGALPPGWTMTVQPDGVPAYSNQSLFLIADIQQIENTEPCEDRTVPVLPVRKRRKRKRIRRTTGNWKNIPVTYELKGTFGPNIYPPNEPVMRKILEINQEQVSAYLFNNTDSSFNLNWLNKKLADEWDYEDENFKNFNKGFCGAILGIPVEAVVSDGYRPGYGYNRQISPIAERAIKRGYAYGSRRR